MVGPGPFDHVAEKAVGMPPEPSSTLKPSARSVLTYHAAERYSRHAVSARCQMREFHADHSGCFSSTQRKASARDQLRVPSEVRIATAGVRLGRTLEGLRP